jgi:peptidoglycan/LPS O-acetylase OafA/YrhL
MTEPTPASQARLDVGAGAHVPALDGLRGIAIALVMAFHFYGASVLLTDAPSFAVDRYVARAVGVGWAGVDLFFVLSGFLITGILLGARGGGSYAFVAFYARRVLRIFPAYYGYLALLIVVLPLVPALASDEGLALLRSHQVWYWTYLYNIWLPLRPLTNIGLFGNGHIWSLAVEEQFYLVWPFVVLLASRRWLPAICALCIVGAFALRVMLVHGEISSLDNVYAPIMLTPARADTFALGALLAIAAQSPEALARVRAWCVPALTAGLSVLAGIWIAHDGLSEHNDFVQTLGFSIIAFTFAALLAVALVATPGGRAERLFTLPALRFLGRYSYALYLFHLQVALLVVNRMGAAGWQLPLAGGSAIPARLAFTAAGAGLSVALAYASWHLYEQHFLKLKRFFPYRARGDQEASRAAAPASSAVDTGEPLPAEVAP